jgi:hypothetical protein
VPGKIGEINPALCISVHAIKQLDHKWDTTNASIFNFFPLSICMSKMTFPTHPRDELLAALRISFPPGSYAIFALSSKLLKMIVLDIPMSGSAVQW